MKIIFWKLNYFRYVGAICIEDQFELMNKIRVICVQREKLEWLSDNLEILEEICTKNDKNEPQWQMLLSETAKKGKWKIDRWKTLIAIAKQYKLEKELKINNQFTGDSVVLMKGLELISPNYKMFENLNESQSKQAKLN